MCIIGVKLITSQKENTANSDIKGDLSPGASCSKVDQLYNQHACKEVSPGLDAPKVAGRFPNLLREAR